MWPCWGVLRYVSREMQGSSSREFFEMFFAIFTADYAFLLPRLWKGEDLTEANS